MMENNPETKSKMFDIVSDNRVAIFFSICTLVMLVGYIIYDQSGRSSADVISDEGVLQGDYEEFAAPLPAISFDVPEKISFAGEPVPLDIPDVRERLDKELQINCYLHSNT